MRSAAVCPEHRAARGGHAGRTSLHSGLNFGLAAGYGVVSLVGGVMGYVKAGSRASLIAGGVCGLGLIGGALLALSQPVVGLAIVLVVSAALVARFGRSVLRASPSRIAYVMVGGGLAVLVFAGAALV
jgi:uncharacterized membrane protein (UPF0136 family)